MVRRDRLHAALDCAMERMADWEQREPDRSAMG